MFQHQQQPPVSPMQPMHSGGYSDQSWNQDYAASPAQMHQNGQYQQPAYQPLYQQQQQQQPYTQHQGYYPPKEQQISPPAAELPEGR